MFRFAHPEWLFLLFLLLPVILLGFWGWNRKKRLLASFFLSPKKVLRRHQEKYAIFSLIVVVSGFLLASPRVSLFQAAEKEGEMIFLVDVSLSMAARKTLQLPSRLERAKGTVAYLLDEFPAATVALCGYTMLGRCFSPPTKDHTYVKRSLERVLRIDAVPIPGTNILGAIENVMGKFSPRAPAKVLVVLGDGDPYGVGKDDRAAQFLGGDIQKKNIKLFIVGVGEQEGTLIPLYDEKGRFVGYARGGYPPRLYLSSLDRDWLQRIAEYSGGRYFSEGEEKELRSAIGKVLVAGKPAEGDMTRFLLIPIVLLTIMFCRKHIRT